MIAPTETGWRCARPRCRNTKHHAQGHCRACYEKQRVGGQLERRVIYTDPQPVRERVAEHQRRGRSRRDLAALAGVDHTGLVRVATGVRVHVTTRTARRILAVPLPPTHIGTQRRIQALSRIGHTWRSIAAEAGGTFPALASGMTCGRFRAWLSVPVAEVFERWALTPGPSSHTRLRAQRNNWPAPGAWTGIDIDDPTAVADAGPPSKVTAVDRITEVEHLTSMGIAVDAACKQVGIKPATLNSMRWRLAQRPPATVTELRPLVSVCACGTQLTAEQVRRRWTECMACWRRPSTSDGAA